MTTIGEAIGETLSAMSEIERIVRETYGDPEAMAHALHLWASESETPHTQSWVVKKAHDALNQIEWERDHAPLNVLNGLPEEYVG